MTNMKSLAPLIVIIALIILAACETEEPELAATATPTATPVPTPTPTATPVPTPTPTLTLTPTEKCKDLVSRLGLEERGMIHDVKSEPPTGDQTLHCSGRWENPDGEITPLRFFVYIDESGEMDTDIDVDWSLGTCEDLSPRIIKLSKDNENPFRPRILKIYDIKGEPASGDEILSCSGRAKLSRGNDSRIRFHITEDEDGDQFIGYREE